jgi:DNA-binding transcriptional LysR family regulator
MADDAKDARSRILDRANRMLNQSRTLRKLANELRDESGVIRAGAKSMTRKKKPAKKTKS